MQVGVLALQGDFDAHARRLAQLGAEPVAVRYASQLRSVDGLILPGGESSTNIILLEREGIW
ncbi:MAG: pyridoxal 5'-phosphate synthase glutaminase subunit PdxT, partial [Bryobacterales bacterium]|nr:pyridoxal 5'-phosphate synthase glutaminase subunit PdxT [Bryobacterales bacterium]